LYLLAFRINPEVWRGKDLYPEVWAGEGLFTLYDTVSRCQQYEHGVLATLSSTCIYIHIWM